MKFGSTSSMNINWPSMASMASMRSSGVAGLSGCVSSFFVLISSDIGAVFAIVANGEGLSFSLAGVAVGCVLMAAFV